MPSNGNSDGCGDCYFSSVNVTLPEYIFKLLSHGHISSLFFFFCYIRLCFLLISYQRSDAALDAVSLVWEQQSSMLMPPLLSKITGYRAAGIYLERKKNAVAEEGWEKQHNLKCPVTEWQGGFSNNKRSASQYSWWWCQIMSTWQNLGIVKKSNASKVRRKAHH